ncbi:uncharacterized protein LOC129000564 [Macrosteles quadrilineatus]|uniref:uncharacterized protein LOC129000564 n=1 Tax=Macrosteles quadrilineatus TaxID=74068 RepID=UPI0023E094D8|nr:uncharacterized protein LOC129000564 [Macrosteles quadrilineatus]
MKQDIARYVNHCKICQQVKYDQQRPSGFMGSYRGVAKPFEMISTDVLGPLPRSSAGHKYLFVVMCTFTKFPLLFPLREITASTIAKQLEDDVFMLFEVPSYIICDNGSEIRGKQVQELSRSYNIKLLYNARRHAQANPIERVNKTLGPMLRAYIGENHRHWDRNIAKYGFALRSAKHEATSYSPAYLNFGRELIAINEDADPTNSSEEASQVEESSAYGDRWKELKNIYKDVNGKLREAHEKQAERYNLRRREVVFKEGSLIGSKEKLSHI